MQSLESILQGDVMGKKINIILGNGFSIDFINFYSSIDSKAKKINLSNLFVDGAHLKWPLDNRPGFLSFRNTPSLWSIGARPGMSASDSMALIEKVVTCANVYSLRSPSEIRDGNGNGFLHAYKELVYYLKYLFVHYNSLISDINEKVIEWPWASFLKKASLNPDVDEINIVTYNYDIWLERVLLKLGIDFEIPLIGNKNPLAKIKIIKPHGSISFLHKQKLDISSFSINYKNFTNDCSISDIIVDYDDMGRHCLVNFLTPPAGEMQRANQSWAKSVLQEASNKFGESNSSDLAIICGLSYWHVDRSELDNLINRFDSNIDLIHLNPYPSQTLDAVLNSLFQRYIQLGSAEVLEEAL